MEQWGWEHSSPWTTNSHGVMMLGGGTEWNNLAGCIVLYTWAWGGENGCSVGCGVYSMSFCDSSSIFFCMDCIAFSINSWQLFETLALTAPSLWQYSQWASSPCRFHQPVSSFTVHQILQAAISLWFLLVLYFHSPCYLCSSSSLVFRRLVLRVGHASCSVVGSFSWGNSKFPSMKSSSNCIIAFRDPVSGWQ